LPPSIHEKTLIFDLDETLVHCIDDILNNQYDHKISVTFPTGEKIEAGINIRPYAYECLKQAA
jgi:CTD small phosphatase-like protein 2